VRYSASLLHYYLQDKSFTTGTDKKIEYFEGRTDVSVINLSSRAHNAIFHRNYTRGFLRTEY
jgi:hypothetical protein